MQKMAELDGRFGTNDGSGPKDIKLATAIHVTGNPDASDDAGQPLLEGGK